jgi:phosphatidylserine decarboxylase
MHHLLLRCVPRRALTRLAGWLAERRRPRWLLRAAIRLYIRAFGIDMSSFAGSPESFETFNAFFTRPLRPDRRETDPDPAAIVSPVDGRVSALGAIEQGRLIQAKGREYSLEAFLGGDSAWRDYLGGQFLTLYLAPPDYHRIHVPVSCAVTRFRYIPGEFWSVSEAGLASVPRLYERNERLVNFLRGDFGEMALVAVGAMIVGRIRVVYHQELVDRRQPMPRAETLASPYPLAKGAELGRFELGSSVVLLMPPGQAALERLPPGQPVRMGQAVARLLRAGGG